MLDVGTGPNLFPLLCALPFAASVTAWEYSQSNVDWLEAELRRTTLRPVWQRFRDIVAEASDGDLEAENALATRVTVEKASIYDLPPRGWDAATMFFCAESITRDRAEFVRACTAYACAVRPGGLLAAAFLARSTGYEVAGESYPAVPITPEGVIAAFSGVATDIVVRAVGGTTVQTHSGYSGALFLTAKAC